GWAGTGGTVLRREFSLRAIEQGHGPASAMGKAEPGGKPWFLGARCADKSGYQPQRLHRTMPPSLTASLAMRDRYPPNGSVMLWFAWWHVGCISPGQSGSGADRHD